MTGNTYVTKLSTIIAGNLEYLYLCIMIKHNGQIINIDKGVAIVKIELSEGGCKDCSIASACKTRETKTVEISVGNSLLKKGDLVTVCERRRIPLYINAIILLLIILAFIFPTNYIFTIALVVFFSIRIIFSDRLSKVSYYLIPDDKKQ